MISIIDYNAGNLKSIANMLRVLGIKCQTASTPKEIMEAERLILPGVGHFDFGMTELEKRGLVGALNVRVLENKVPILGICLGAQLLTLGSEEGDKQGLSWIDGETVKFDASRLGASLRIPRMGWSDTWSALSENEENPLTHNLPHDMRFYYVHSYHMTCSDPKQALLCADYGYSYLAGVRRDNILGVQFHPEKSHRYGMALLRNFYAWEPLS